MERATVDNIKHLVETYVPKSDTITFVCEEDNTYKSIDIYYIQHNKLHSTWYKDLSINYPQDVFDLYNDIFTKLIFESGTFKVLKTYDGYSFPMQGTIFPLVRYYFNQYR